MNGKRSPAPKRSPDDSGNAHEPAFLKASGRKLALVPLIAATFFVVSGGPYGTEDIVGKAGYAGALLILLLVPLLWSAPTALMVAEMSSALPREGGFYEWVKRGLGPFWGFQESWLTLVGSIFDMALYPTLFVFYISHFFPQLAVGRWPTVLGLGMIFGCTIWNVVGTRAVGYGSLLFGVLLLAPFAVLVAVALAHPVAGAGAGAAAGQSGLPSHTDWLGAILIAMWNLMGWDNPSTFAGEVERPQRAYPLTMAGALTLIAVIYLIPIAAVAHSGIDPSRWTTGGWVDLAREFGGEGLAAAIAAGGVISAFGTFNALMLSLSRLPLVMTEDGFLPPVFARLNRRTGMPWVAISACAVGWALAFGLGFVALAVIDVLLTGLSVMLEFAAFLALRRREPELARPFRVPGGWAGAIGVCVFPVALMTLALARNATQPAGPFNALTMDLILIAAGPAIYFVSRGYQRRRAPARAAVAR